MSNRSLANRRLTLPGGADLAYRDNGRGPEAAAAQPAIVLLHGFCGSSAYWEKLLPMLESRHRVIAVDLRGHGKSSGAGDQILPMEQLGEDVAELLKSLETGPVVLMGHSMGGYAALALAEKYPELLAGFGLIHSTPLPDSPEAREGRDKAAAALADNGIVPFVDGLVPKLFAPAYAGTELADRAKEIGYGTAPADAAAAALGMKQRPDRSAVLEALELPLLLVAGSEDGVIPPAKVFAAKGSRTRAEVLDGAGHMSMLEQPEQLASLIGSWLENDTTA
ncbi:alpha/beta hydrolase [Paenibacillus pasadenensis]|uniref:alpha/beta fold hydrolase n=1 Tax=Paenibacillus pasadenensis TaxID=217090 RepID=UPI00203B79B3|nr:alpha/beta hydrolase [Paenibacillus pasadenensis]MCM3748307.1 alpha/beta hydrolase [Paenibacillus pasadenensis]